MTRRIAVLFSTPVYFPLLRRRLGGLAASASLHLLVALLASGGPRTAPGAPDQLAGPLVMPVGADSLTPQAQTVDATPEGPEFRPPLEISGVSADLAKLLARRDTLFPFLTHETLLLDPRDAHPERGTSLRNPFGSRRRLETRPPLRLSDRALQTLVDRAWSRRERWRPFAPIAALVESHDPDLGRAAELLQAYSDQNLLQPYYDADTRDARFWAMLGLAADHVWFIKLVRRFAADRPSSKVTTELLFLLDELVQGSRDTLLMLTSTDPTAALRRTASEHPDAYALALALRAQYGEWLRQRGLESGDAIRVKYDAVRLQLLSTIVDRSPNGYRVADARYLAGVIMFEQNDLASAERWWRGIEPASGDSYAEAYAEVMSAMRVPSGRRAALIVAALGGQHRRWLDFSERRLRRFGHAVDGF